MYTLVGGGDTYGRQTGGLASSYSRGVSVDSSNNVFVGDPSNYYVHQVYLSGTAWYITTVFATGPKSGCSVSTVAFVTSLAVDSS